MNKFPYLLSITLFLAACATSAPQETATTPRAAELLAYATPTETATPVTDTSAATATPLPLPTPTPIYIKVETGDTLLAIASRYGVKLNDLLTANPGIDPQFLSVGTELLIPQIDGEGVVSSLPQPTPVPLPLSAPECIADATGGLWCVSLVNNMQSIDMENVIVLMQLMNTENEIVANQAATLLLNRLPAGEVWPVLVHFPPPISTWERATAQLSAALPITEVEGRYLDVTLTEPTFVIGADGKAAKLNVVLTLDEQAVAADVEKDTATVAVMLIAYDTAGQVVGVNRWQSEEAIAPSTSLEITTWVYSLGPEIANVAVFAEALPHE